MSRGGHRESLTPMDFEYDNKQGPVDHRSPFLNITNSPRREHDLSPSPPLAAEETHQLTKGPPFGQPGPPSQFNSPTKNAFATPNRLRETALTFPQSGGKPLPSLPPHTNAWTPRTPAADYDFSSGGETPNTPAQDSEHATPDTQMAGKMQLLMDSPSPKKTGRRQSLFKRFSTWGSPSPTKDSIKEMEKEVLRKHYSDKMDSRVAKRRSTRERSDRSKKKQMALRDDDNNEESDNEPAQVQKSAPTKPAQVQPTYGASIAGFFHWIEAHPGLPSVLSWYMQFTVNAFLAISFMYIMYLVYSGITADINIESNKHASEMMVEIAHCAKNYRENRCDPETRVPAMEMACGNWETCMSRDPNKLARASVTVKTFAVIINSFFEEFSYKSMIFLTIIIFGGFNVSNWAFGLLRQQHSQPQQPPYNDYAPPPQTPHRINSNSYIENGQQAWPTPYQTPYEGRGFIQPSQPPMLQHTQSTPALPSYAQEGTREELKTPSRRRGFR